MHVSVNEHGQIAGTRITVYDVLDYHQAGHHPTFIAATLSLCSEQVAAALRFIEDHRPQVLAEYKKMLKRDKKGNSSILEDKIADSHKKLQKLIRSKKNIPMEERSGAGYPGRH